MIEKEASQRRRPSSAMCIGSGQNVGVNPGAVDGLSISEIVASGKPVLCERPIHFAFDDGYGFRTGGNDFGGTRLENTEVESAALP